MNTESERKNTRLRARPIGCLGPAIGGLSGGILLIVLWVSRPYFASQTFSSPPAAQVTVIEFVPAPEPTATMSLPTPSATPAPLVYPPGGEDLAIGALVQVVGTEGENLRLRREPGLEAIIMFLALESEVFEIRDGPQTVDGFVWWFVVNPYDLSKQGWAVSNFLGPLQQ